MAWTDILGHDSAKQLLQANLADGTVAHAYLLAGPDGVGKRQLALEMVRTLMGPARGSVQPDLHLIAPSGASNQIKIEDIRTLLGRVALRPFNAAFQVAFIDGVDRLTDEAANSLLKALEEPSKYTKFLLITSRLSFCLPTIVSRCQLVQCSALSPEVITRLLMERHACDASVAESVSRLACGSLSRAADLAGRWTAYQRLCERLADAHPTTWLEQPLPESREAVAQLLEAMIAWLRDVSVAAVDRARIAHAAHAAALSRQAASIDIEHCADTALALHALRESLDQFISPRLVASLAREHWFGLIGGRAAAHG